MTAFKAALVQMRSGTDMARNLKGAEALVREAAATGAPYVLTPEVSNIFEPDKDRLRAIVLPERDDSMAKRFSELAKELRIHLHAGSLAVKAEDGRIANRSLVYGPDGKIIARYDKVHLFDIDLPNGESYRESATYTPGAHATAVKLPFAKLGLCICYDVRFPRLANTYANSGATVLTYPAAFTVPTGEAHWHVLLRARAIETGSFVLAAAQGGTHDSGKATYGHSIAISPWGEILAEAGTEPCVITADIDPEASSSARGRIPALKNARDFALKQA
jgi:deaminated glutathione amidase